MAQDSMLLPSCLYPVAVARDNEGIKPAMDVTSGTPHIALIGATAVGVSSTQATLPTPADLKYSLRVKEITVDMLKEGPRDEDPSTFEGFETSLFLASWTE